MPRIFVDIIDEEFSDSHDVCKDCFKDLTKVEDAVNDYGSWDKETYNDYDQDGDAEEIIKENADCNTHYKCSRCNCKLTLKNF